MIFDTAVLLLCGGFTALFAVALAATVVGTRRIVKLRDVVPDSLETMPLVSIISPACDEVDSVRDAVRSWLGQGYPNLQVIVVDDRSTDGTDAVVDALAAEDSRVVAAHVTELPEGWLGKLNAVHRGIGMATGEWLLVADADTHLGPDALRKAITYANRAGRDFLSVVPQIETAGFWGDCVWNVTLAFFHAAMRPWKIPDPTSPVVGASGAFLLMRRAAFDRGPGMPWLRLEVADDFGMCLLIKEHGGSAELLCGAGEVRLTWYASYAEMARRMQKNLFAITGRFSLGRTVLQGMALAALGLWPLLALLRPTPAVLGVTALGMGLFVANAWIAATWAGRPRWPSLAAPLGSLLSAFMIVRAGWLGHRIGGIEWRGQIYPTALLRAAQRVRL